MASGAEHKNWWETNLDWSLSGSLHETVEAFRTLPSTLNAHRLNKPSPVDSLAPDPVEKIKMNDDSAPARAERQPRIIEAPPKPACLQKKLTNSQSIKLRGVNIPPKVQPRGALTLEKLLDPDFCDY